MRTLNKILTTVCVIALPYITHAQNGQKLVSISTSVTEYLINNCEKCDSLGDAYLQNGDTSMALYYYEKYLDANPYEEQTKTAVQKFRRLYSSHNQSFYLKEY